jgi:hypothetical protein
MQQYHGADHAALTIIDFSDSTSRSLSVRHREITACAIPSARALQYREAAQTTLAWVFVANSKDSSSCDPGTLALDALHRKTYITTTARLGNVVTISQQKNS